MTLSLPLQARDGFSGLPIHEIFPTTTGIIFPSFLTAGGINPATLPQKGKKQSAFGLDYSPAPGGVGEHKFGFSYATADNRLGMNVGYQGAFGNSLANGVYLGGGFRSESTALGVGLRIPDFRTSFSPSTDLGIVSRTKSDLSFGLVLYKLESAPQVDLGVGFGKDKSYNFEINMLLPPIAEMFQQNSEYIITAATTVYAGPLGLSFNSSYNLRTSEVAQSVSLLIWLFKNFAITAQYRSPNRSYYGVILPF